MFILNLFFVPAVNDLLQYLQRNVEALGLTEEDVLNLARKYGLVIN